MSAPEPAWDLYRSFIAVLRNGSLSGAARALGLTQPTLSRHIEALEAALGLELFTRSQQGLSPTEAARDLAPLAESLAATAAALVRAASGQSKAVEGTVRVSASEIMGAEVLPPILASARAAHPALEIELVLSNAVDNLLLRDADIAVRMVEPAQDALVVRRIGAVSLGFYGRRDYLACRGAPRDLVELGRHSLIGYDRETPAIRSMRKRMPAFEGLHFALRTDSDLAQLAAIRAGFGIGACQVALGERDPELVRVLADAFGPKLELWIAMHEDLRSTPRCRAVFDALVGGLESHVDA